MVKFFLCIIIFITSSCILPEMTFFLLCVLWLTFKWGVQRYSDYLITRWNIQSLKNRNVWGFFHRTLKSFETCAGLPRRCYLKRKRQFYSSFACFFFSHSFYILFSSAARRNLFRTAQRILRTSERVSKGFCLFWDKWNRMHSNNALVLINSWDSSPSEGQQKIGVIFIPFLISKLSNGLHR